jgi:hypothetical protein
MKLAPVCIDMKLEVRLREEHEGGSRRKCREVDTRG